MRYGKVFLSFFTAALFMAAMFLGWKEAEMNRKIPVSVTIEVQEETEPLSCWKNSKGDYYIFLPSFADLSHTRLQTHASGTLTLDSRPVTNGMTLENLALDTPYHLVHTQWSGTYEYTVTFIRSANVPALYLDVKSGTMDFIHQEKGNSESGSMRLYMPDGTLHCTTDFKDLDGRGNSTWDLKKKPYNLTLSQAYDLMGMGTAQEWILLANAYDASHLRNKVAYDFSQVLGLAYTPSSEWVDLYLNGEYVGLYLLCERNEVHPQRVDIAQEGSFLVSKEWEWRMNAQEIPFITTNAGTALRIRYATMDEEAILNIWQSAENAILADDGIDPVTGKHWRELIDLDSWAAKYLVEEVFGNTDGSTLSQYFYYDGSGDGRIYAGPVWDFDLSMGNTVAIQSNYPRQFFANKADVWGSPWFHALYNDEEFYARVTRLYETTFQPLLEELLDNGLAQYAAQIAQASTMNQIRWNVRNALDEYADVKTYMNIRMEFLNDIWIKGEEFILVTANGYDGAKYCYALHPGDYIPELKTYDVQNVDFQGWYYADTETPLDMTQPIWEDTEIYLKYAPILAEEAAEPVSPLRYAPALLFALLLVCAGLWDALRQKGHKHERQKHKVSP